MVPSNEIVSLPLVACVFVCLAQLATAQPLPISDNAGIVPMPQRIKVADGRFILPKQLKISVSDEETRRIAGLLNASLEQFSITSAVTGNPASAQIRLEKKGRDSAPEGYKLTVDKTGVTITAGDGAGLFYGTQSLLQLLPLDGVLEIPFVEIVDEPRFRWRGMMLDVSRHFFPVEFVKRFIDFLAMYKMNSFHWHLTEDQGWRIEIKKYPRLTEVSAFRKETVIGAQQLLKKDAYVYDGIPHGGFYTQEQIRDIVAYAKERYITIVPEIEMPGHTRSVLAAYPELACRPGEYEVWTRWGVNPDIVCPSEATIQFFQDVLAEVCDLFPGPYVHIGGDEAPKERWKESPVVQEIMRREGITDVEKVQGWFNTHIERFLQSRGKKMIGWDEILEGGVTPSTIVMSWRGEKGGIEAANHGNDAVMSPYDYVYFDYGQNPVPHHPDEPVMICCFLPVSKVYEYNPISDQITPEQRKHILGVQANLWTEYIPTPEKAEYMLFPRAIALAEVAWTPAEKKNWEGFVPRLSKHLQILDRMKVNYRVPEPEGLQAATVADSSVTIALSTIVKDAEIRYTLDGYMPSETTRLYTGPFTIPANRNIKVRAVTIAPNGRRSAPAERRFPETVEKLSR